MVGGYAGVAGPLTALGGTASVGGFSIFAVGLLGSVRSFTWTSIRVNRRAAG